MDTNLRKIGEAQMSLGYNIPLVTSLCDISPDVFSMSRSEQVEHLSHSVSCVRRRMIWNIRGDFGAEVIGSSGSGYAA